MDHLLMWIMDSATQNATTSMWFSKPALGVYTLIGNFLLMIISGVFGHFKPRQEAKAKVWQQKIEEKFEEYKGLYARLSLIYEGLKKYKAGKYDVKKQLFTDIKEAIDWTEDKLIEKGYYFDWKTVKSLKKFIKKELKPVVNKLERASKEKGLELYKNKDCKKIMERLDKFISYMQKKSRRIMRLW